jgi:hypothetical protein
MDAITKLTFFASTYIKSFQFIRITETLRCLFCNHMLLTSGAYLINSEDIIKKGASPMSGMKM